MNKLLIILFILGLAIPLIAEAGIENPVEVLSNVTPATGSHYLTENPLSRLDVYTFKYSFDLKDLGSDTKDRWHDDLVLGIQDISNTTSNDNWILLKNNKNLSESTLVFTVNFTDIFKKKLFGELRYRLYDKDKILEESSGPKIAFVFRNEKSEKKSNGVYSYSVEVLSSINNSTIYIKYEDRKGRWNLYNVTKTYVSNNTEWKLLEWVDAPYFYRLEFVPDLGSMQINAISPISRNNQSESVGNISPSFPSEAEKNELIIDHAYVDDPVKLKTQMPDYANDSYSGIFSYPGKAIPGYPGSIAPVDSQVETIYGVTRISVQNFVEKEIKVSDDLVEYLIMVRNTGITPLFDVRLTDVLPEGMVISSWEEIDENGDLVPSNESKFSVIDAKDRSLTLRLGDIDRDSSKWLVIYARMNTDAWLKDRNIYLNNQVAASGEYKGIKVESTAGALLQPEVPLGMAPSGEVIE